MQAIHRGRDLICELLASEAAWRAPDITDRFELEFFHIFPGWGDEARKASRCKDTHKAFVTKQVKRPY